MTRPKPHILRLVNFRGQQLNSSSEQDVLVRVQTCCKPIESSIDGNLRYVYGAGRRSEVADPIILRRRIK